MKLEFSFLDIDTSLSPQSVPVDCSFRINSNIAFFSDINDYFILKSKSLSFPPDTIFCLIKKLYLLNKQMFTWHWPHYVQSMMGLIFINLIHFSSCAWHQVMLTVFWKRRGESCKLQKLRSSPQIAHLWN